jgi:hypothetical protein
MFQEITQHFMGVFVILLLLLLVRDLELFLGRGGSLGNL